MGVKRHTVQRVQIHSPPPVRSATRTKEMTMAMMRVVVPESRLARICVGGGMSESQTEQVKRGFDTVSRKSKK